MPCPLDTTEQQPWHTRDALFSPASLIGGVLLVAFGTLALVSIRPWVGLAVFGLIGSIIVGAAVLQWHRGHRGWCLLRRALWFGLAVPGAPMRLLASAP
jgi:hypothetical protein